MVFANLELNLLSLAKLTQAKERGVFRHLDLDLASKAEFSEDLAFCLLHEMR